jgi:serine/threonine protein phosphatase 1
MRILAIGDIHGCSRALAALLAAVAPTAADTLITLGDYVDRGPDSRGVLDQLTALYEQGRLIPLRGNHDQMMLDCARNLHTLNLWLACGGAQTLASYGVTLPGGEGVENIPARHWTFLHAALRDWYETDRHFFVHANAHPDVSFAEQPEYMLLWEKLYEPCVHVSGKVMVCGHTRMRCGRPRHLGSTICIDTGAYDPGGWLTCLDVVSGRYWQANEKGEVRTGLLVAEEDDAVLEPPLEP